MSALDVLLLDNHLLAVNKPPGLLVQADATGDLDLLSLGKRFLKERFDKPGNVFLGLVHRLDRPVSGVVLLARTSKAAARLAAQFRARTPEKRYLALVEGRLLGEGRREDHLAKVDRTVRVVRASHPAARPAALRWRALGTTRRRGGDVSLVEVLLETGRAHQIRAQLAAMGHPILGDLRYGARRPFDGQYVALHAVALTVEHPTRRVPLHLRAAPPPSWRGHFDALVAEAVAAG